MKVRMIAAGLALATVAMPAFVSAAEDDAAAEMAATGTAYVAPAAPVATSVVLGANTPIALTLNSPLTTKANYTGDKFSLTVAQDVLVDGHVVIPRGTRAMGLVTYAKGNGSFGKSGKMELAFKYLELEGQQIPLDGTYYQEGAGNTAGTVGAVLAAGVVGGLVVKGHSAEIVQGKDFSATLLNDVAFVSTDGVIALDAGYRPEPVSMQTETEKERKKRLKAEKKKNKG